MSSDGEEAVTGDVRWWGRGSYRWCQVVEKRQLQVNSDGGEEAATGDVSWWGRGRTVCSIWEQKQLSRSRTKGRSVDGRVDGRGRDAVSTWGRPWSSRRAPADWSPVFRAPPGLLWTVGCPGEELLLILWDNRRSTCWSKGWMEQELPLRVNRKKSALSFSSTFGPSFLSRSSNRSQIRSRSRSRKQAAPDSPLNSDHPPNLSLWYPACYMIHLCMVWSVGVGAEREGAGTLGAWILEAGRLGAEIEYSDN